MAFSDLRLGSPPRFKEKDFITIESFEFQVKLLPLLFKDIQVKRFVLVGPKIVLEKSKDGKASWEGLGKVETEVTAKPEAKEKTPKDKGMKEARRRSFFDNLRLEANFFQETNEPLCDSVQIEFALRFPNQLESFPDWPKEKAERDNDEDSENELFHLV